ncbi:hypothetical protein D9M68_794250 [compost metagenome]
MRRKTHQPQVHAGQVHVVHQRLACQHDEAHIVVEQRGRREVVGGDRRIVDEAHVRLAAFHQRHHFRRAAAHDRQVHVFVAADETGHHLRHEVVAKRVHGGQPDGSLRHAFALAHGLQHAVDVAIGRLDAVQQARAGLGQLHAPARADEERLTHIGFQRRQLPAQPGLRLVQVLGRPRQRFQFRDAQEIAQLPVRCVHTAPAPFYLMRACRRG